MNEAEIAAEVFPRVKEMVAAELRKKVMDSLSYQVQSQMQEEIKKYFTERVAPEVAKALEKQREDLIAGMILAIGDVAKDLGEAMRKEIMEKAAKTLTQSHVIREIFEKITRGY